MLYFFCCKVVRLTTFCTIVICGNLSVFEYSIYIWSTGTLVIGVSRMYQSAFSKLIVSVQYIPKVFVKLVLEFAEYWIYRFLIGGYHLLYSNIKKTIVEIFKGISRRTYLKPYNWTYFYSLSHYFPDFMSGLSAFLSSTEHICRLEG